MTAGGRPRSAAAFFGDSFEFREHFEALRPPGGSLQADRLVERDATTAEVEQFDLILMTKDGEVKVLDFGLATADAGASALDAPYFALCRRAALEESSSKPLAPRKASTSRVGQLPTSFRQWSFNAVLNVWIRLVGKVSLDRFVGVGVALAIYNRRDQVAGVHVRLDGF